MPLHAFKTLNWLWDWSGVHGRCYCPNVMAIRGGLVALTATTTAASVEPNLSKTEQTFSRPHPCQKLSSLQMRRPCSAEIPQIIGFAPLPSPIEMILSLNTDSFLKILSFSPPWNKTVQTMQLNLAKIATNWEHVPINSDRTSCPWKQSQTRPASAFVQTEDKQEPRTRAQHQEDAAYLVFAWKKEQERLGAFLC